MIVNGYRHSFKLPVIVVRANNVYGIRQFPEKLIPCCIMSLIGGKTIPLHGDGSNTRHYLAAQDFAAALVLLINKGQVNETYNIGSKDEFANRDVARMICEQFNLSFDSSVVFVQDRPFNDRRYSISWDKISELGWGTQAQPTPGNSGDRGLVPQECRGHSRQARISPLRVAARDARPSAEIGLGIVVNVRGCQQGIGPHPADIPMLIVPDGRSAVAPGPSDRHSRHNASHSGLPVPVGRIKMLEDAQRLRF